MPIAPGGVDEAAERRQQPGVGGEEGDACWPSRFSIGVALAMTSSPDCAEPMNRNTRA